MMFQVFSRTNSSNGIPYRLVLVYSKLGAICKAYEERDSRPAICGELYQQGAQQLPSIDLSVKEYNNLKRIASPWLVKI